MNKDSAGPVFSLLMLEDNMLVISGQILPQIVNENVTLQAKINNDSWTTIATVKTQQDGRFSYNWMPLTSGVIDIRASWLGNSLYNDVTSVQSSVIILTYLFLILILALVLAVMVLVLAFVMVRRIKSPTSKLLFPELSPQ